MRTRTAASGVGHAGAAAACRQRCLTIAALAVLAGCADFDPPVPADAKLPDAVVDDPSFAADLQPIFTARCATSSCHSLAVHQAGLVLVPGHAYDSLVGIPARLAPGLARVEPGAPDVSFLMVVLSDTADRFGVPRMPLGQRPLTANQIATIRNWIARGARRN